MIITHAVDWLEGTLMESCDNEQHLKTTAARLTDTSAADWRRDKGFNRYKMGVRHDSGMRALCGREDMGTHLIASGSALAGLRLMGRETADLIEHVLDQNMRPTRIDLAIDAVDSRMNFLRLKREFSHKRAVTKASVWYLVQSADNGWTLYVGAPQSDKHMRIYNKNAEVKHKATCPPGADDWIRIELVLMRQWARRAARVVVQTTVGDTARGAIRAFADIPTDAAWLAVMAGKQSALASSSRKTTDTAAWLTGVVAKVLARECIASPQLYVDFLGAFRREYEVASRPIPDPPVRVDG